MRRKKCARSGLGRLAVRICLLAAGLAGVVAASHAAASPLPREQAVVLARQGAYEEALAILHSEHRDDPVDPNVLHDYLAVLSWAGHDRDVLSLLPRIDADRAPPYVLEAAAKSLRNLKDYTGAATLYRTGRERFPHQLVFPLGLIYSLTDAGRLPEARTLAENLADRHPEQIDPQFAEAYVAVAGQDYLAALSIYQGILELVPGNRQALRLQALALAALGSPFLAAELADRNEGLLTPAESLRLRGDQAALAVRWGTYGSDNDRERFVETDRALAMLEENRQRAQQAGPEGKSLELQTRFDRLVALRDRGRMQEVADDYRQLRADGVELPPHALEAAGDALLYLEQPEAAGEIYQQVLAKEPGDFEAQLGLFYAYIEQEDFASAKRVIEEVRERQRILLPTAGNREPRPNPFRLEADLTAAIGLSLADDYRQAESRLTAMHQQAPANLDILRELSDVYARRGWPRKAEESYRLGLGLEPRHLGLRVGRAENRFELAEFRQAEQAIVELHEVFPENKAVQRLQRLWESHNLRELRLRADSGWSSGSTFGSHDLTIEAALFSRPVSYHYRGFVSSYLARGEFPEGNKTWLRQGAGVEYRGPQLQGSAELTWNLSGGRKLGGRLAGEWLIDDHWSLPFALEAFSRHTPLRAVKHGIRADEISSGLVWRQSELRRGYLNLQALDFSDGNFRYRVDAGMAQRLLTRPHYLLNAYLDLATSGNSRDDTPYFNPDQDAELSLTLENDWLLWRRYHRSFRHRLALSVGGYWQQDFGSDPVGGVRYEHVWEVFPRFSLLYGATWQHAVYDGDDENRIGGHLELNWRF